MEATEKKDFQPRKGLSLFFSTPVLAWALYDLANTIFSSNILTIFFPLFLVDVIGGDARLDQIASSFVSYTSAIASFFLVLLSPLFGVWIDRTGRKKRYIIPFTLITVSATITMGYFAAKSSSTTFLGLPISLAMVLLLFMVAKFFYHSSLVFYDSMISDIGSGKEIPLISGFGVAVGYIGTLIGLAVYPLVASKGYSIGFILSGVLFLLFSLPLMFFTKEKKRPQVNTSKGFLSGYKEIFQTFKEARQYKGILLFMGAYFFFNDAIATAIAMMAVYAKTIIGFSDGEFILLYLVATIFSIVGSFIFGYISKNIGAKKAVTIVSAILLIALCLATFAMSATVFWVAGALYGIAMGAMWVTSRTMIVELSPEDKRGQFFGLFAFSGKVSAIVGPALYGTITLIFANFGTIASRFALASLMLLVLIGFIFHLKVPYNEEKNRRQALDM
jgi:MFS transporter, UMF1 family